MNVAASAFRDIRQLIRTDADGLLSTIINSTCITDAGLAVSGMRISVPERTVVGALNLRATLEEFPASPFPMRTDMEQLVRVENLRQDRSSWVKDDSGEDGPFCIEVLGQGNLCYDIVLAADGERAFFKPGPVGDHFVDAHALELLMRHDGLLRGVTDLIHSMGIVFNPAFYMTIEEWQFEHAAESLGELSELF